jgi:hypothetical protein
MLRIFLTDESFRTAAEDLMFDKLVELEMMRNERNKALRELQTYRDRVVNSNVKRRVTGKARTFKKK